MRVLLLIVAVTVDAVAQPELVVQTGHFNTVRAVAYSRDGKLLASGDEAGWIVLWNVDTGDQVRSWKAHASRVSSLAFGSDDTVLISSSLDGSVQIWDPATGESKGKPLLAHRGDQIDSLALSHEGNQDIIATASNNSINDKSVKIWTFSQDSLTDPRPVSEDSSGVSSVVFSPDGGELVTGGHDHTIKLWAIGAGVLTLTHAFKYPQDIEVSSVAFSPDKRWIAGAGGGGNAPVILWDRHTYEQHILPTDNLWITSLGFSPPDGQWLVAGTGEALHLWNLENEEQKVLPTGESLPGRPSDTSVFALAFNRDGTRFASGSDHVVALRNAKAWDEPPRSLQHHVRDITAVALSPDGRLLANADKVGNANGGIRLWDLSGQRGPRRLPGDYPIVIALAFSPHDHLLVSTHYYSDRPPGADAGPKLRSGFGIQMRLNRSDQPSICIRSAMAWRFR
jgi:WD40 repeat protein